MVLPPTYTPLDTIPHRKLLRGVVLLLCSDAPSVVRVLDEFEAQVEFRAVRPTRAHLTDPRRAVPTKVPRRKENSKASACIEPTTMAGTPIGTTVMRNSPPGKVRLFAILQSNFLRHEMKLDGSGLHLFNVLNPMFIWVKWSLGGVPTSKIPCCKDKLSLLDLAAETTGVDGLWLEFGVFQGRSLNHLAGLTSGKVYGFDSFEGLPRGWTPSVKAGAFSTGGILPSTAENVVLVKGWFQHTLPEFLRVNPDTSVALIHIDCDLYESARFVLWELRSRMRPGTVIVFDEFAGVMPDDEARAFREIVRSTGIRCQYLGYSAHGSVAVRIVALSPCSEKAG